MLHGLLIFSFIKHASSSYAALACTIYCIKLALLKLCSKSLDILDAQFVIRLSSPKII
jgi:hypothetical protein